MSSMTCFDDLPDLVLIELLSYLSSFDVLWGLTQLNYRLTMLINERRYFHRINLSSARYYQFRTILRFLPLDDIESLVMDTHASPLQLLRWPYLPRLRTLCVIDIFNYDDLLCFALLHAATLTHLIVKANERSNSDGLTIDRYYPVGDIITSLKKVLFVYLTALRHLDLGVSYPGTNWPMTTAIVPLTFIRLRLRDIEILVKLMSTSPLSNTLRQLHVQIHRSIYSSFSSAANCNVPVEMINLHTFTLAQDFFSQSEIEWTHFELLTSSKVMPALRRANIALLMNIDGFGCISSAPLFTDHRRVDVNFAFSLVDCPRYNEMTQFIPRGSRFHPRETAGATFAVSSWCNRSEWLPYGEPYNSKRHSYYHHIWYTLPWVFDELFHEYIPYKWITKVHVFHLSCPTTTTTTNKSSLRTLDASGQTLASCLISLPHVVITNCIETFHLSFCNQSIAIDSFNIRNLTLVNSINCLSSCSRFPPTIRAVRILSFHRFPNYVLPDWLMVLHSLSTLPQLISLRIFMFDLLETVNDDSCQMIAKAASLLSDFSFCFRHKYSSSADSERLLLAFMDHEKFIKKLCHCILLLTGQKSPCYSIEVDGYGLTVWS